MEWQSKGQIPYNIMDQYRSKRVKNESIYQPDLLLPVVNQSASQWSITYDSYTNQTYSEMNNVVYNYSQTNPSTNDNFYYNSHQNSGSQNSLNHINNYQSLHDTATGSVERQLDADVRDLIGAVHASFRSYLSSIDLKLQEHQLTLNNYQMINGNSKMFIELLEYFRCYSVNFHEFVERIPGWLSQIY